MQVVGSTTWLTVFPHLLVMVLVLSIIYRWTNELVEVKGAFLCGNFQEEMLIYMKVPEGFERNYPGEVMLLLLRTIYGLKQAAQAF